MHWQGPLSNCSTRWVSCNESLCHLYTGTAHLKKRETLSLWERDDGTKRRLWVEASVTQLVWVQPLSCICLSDSFVVLSVKRRERETQTWLSRTSARCREWGKRAGEKPKGKKKRRAGRNIAFRGQALGFYVSNSTMKRKDRSSNRVNNR